MKKTNKGFKDLSSPSRSGPPPEGGDAMRDGENWGQTGDEVAGKQSWVGRARWEEMTGAFRLGELSVLSPADLRGWNAGLLGT